MDPNEHIPAVPNTEQPPNKKSPKSKGSSWGIGTVLAVLLTKAKLLLPLLKFGKFGGTLLSMIVSIGAYALATPLPFAVGFVLLMFVHELGHVWAAKQRGLPASAPVFIPFIGAAITLRENPRDAETEAYIALGGPMLGSVGAFVCFFIGYVTDSSFWMSLAYTGFFLNLLNLLPIHPLDGGRIASAISRWIWLGGVIGGLALILYLKSFLFLFIWAMFTWDLYKKYVRQRPGKASSLSCQVHVDAAYLQSLSIPLPGPQHTRVLPFTTFSHVEDRSQVIAFTWDSLLLEKEFIVPDQRQLLIRGVRVSGSERQTSAAYDRLAVNIDIHHEPAPLDVAYYQVPVRQRWIYGIAYSGLAALLGIMMLIAKHLFLFT